MIVVEVELPDERSRLCEQVLRDLPEWFGIEAATAASIADVAELPTFRIEDDGFLSLELHTPLAAEVYVMGVRRARHGHGLGSALLRSAEAYLRARGVEYLQVKTLGPFRIREHPQLLPCARLRTARRDPRAMGAESLPDHGEATLMRGARRR